MYTMEYYSAIKNEILSFARKGIGILSNLSLERQVLESVDLAQMLETLGSIFSMANNWSQDIL